MRFCPFCAQETSDNVERCGQCGRKLPPRTMAYGAAPQGRASSRPAAPTDGGATIVDGPRGITEPPPAPPSSRTPCLRARGIAEAAEAMEDEGRSQLPTAAWPQDAGSDEGGAQDLTKPMTRLEAEDLLSRQDSDDAPMTSKDRIPALPLPPASAAEERGRGSSEITPVTRSPDPVTGSLSLSAIRSLGAIPVLPATGSMRSAVGYLWVVARGVYMRRREQLRIRRRLVAVQRSLDGVLLQIGRAAYEEGLSAPPLVEETALLRRAEERRRHALEMCNQLGLSASSEEQRAQAAAGEQRATIEMLTTEAERLSEEIARLVDVRRASLAEAARLEREMRRRGRARPGAAPAVPAGEDTLRPRRQAALDQADAQDGPIGELTHKLGAVRSELGLRKKELQRIQRDKVKTMRALEADLSLWQAERDAADREMQQRMMTIGTLVNLNRISGPRYAPLYQRLDEIKAQLTSFEAMLARLDTEMMSYDRHSVQRGLIIAASGILGSGLLIAIAYLIWALSRR